VSFALDLKLAADSFVVGDLKLSHVVLMNDARFPWVILVPRRPGLVELTDLDADERGRLTEEMTRAAEVLRDWPGVEKINLGLLGNIVRQLHAHVVGRREGDAAWPGPVWGSGVAQAYEPGEAQTRLAWLRNRFGVG
jgi:diadenosine tetraphosphate (Ap4A) HIT family hydrolase